MYYDTIMLYIQAVLASLPHAGLLVLIMMAARRSALVFYIQDTLNHIEFGSCAVYMPICVRFRVIHVHVLVQLLHYRQPPTSRRRGLAAGSRLRGIALLGLLLNLLVVFDRPPPVAREHAPEHISTVHVRRLVQLRDKMERDREMARSALLAIARTTG